MKKSLQYQSQQSGAVVLELVVVLIFFIIPVLIGVIEIGRLLYTYKTIVHQVNHAARFLSMQAPGTGLDKAVCLFKKGRLESNCLEFNSILDGFDEIDFKCSVGDASTSTNHKSVGAGDLGQSVYVNLVTFKVENYRYKFIFSNFFGAAAMTFEPISATYRQVG